MGSLSLDILKRGFNNLLCDAPPTVVPDFLAWVDMKIAEYRLTGYICPRKGTSAEMCSRETIHPVTDNVKLKSPTVEVESHHQPLCENETRDIKSHHKLISQEGNRCPSSPTSQAHPMNLSPAPIGALAKLLAHNHPNSMYSSKLALKVPSLPASPYTSSPVSSYQGSPPPGTTPSKPDSYSALRSLLQGSARVNLTSEFEEKGISKSEAMLLADKNTGKAFDCKECGKSFLHRSSYMRHMKIHQGVFTHHCHTCERKFNRKEHFLRHKCSPLRPGEYGHVEDWGGLSSSPVKLEESWRHAVPSPIEASDYVGKGQEQQEHGETGSESSGQGSPDYYGESRRKKSAPRKVVPDVESHSESYFSDLDESIYESMGIKTENGALDFSMKSNKKHEEEVIPVENGSLDLSMKSVKVLSEKQASTVVNADRKTPRLVAENVYQSLYESPPAGFRIGDLIESAVTKYHSLDGKYMSPTKGDEERAAEFLANNRPQALPQSHDDSAPDKEATGGKADDTNFLSTNTGTYQITTEEVDSDSQMAEVGSTTPNKVIKVVKQGNYLKLKKEAQLIDGELRFICPHCNKVFHRSSNFSRHMRIHRGVFSYICSACNRGFYRKEHYDKHKCYRKAMATTWDRKTRVDMDQEMHEVGDKENMEEGDKEEGYTTPPPGEGGRQGDQPSYPLYEGGLTSVDCGRVQDKGYPLYDSDGEEPNLVIDE